MLSPREIVQHMEVVGDAHDATTSIFILGCLERRVTLYSQQVRALNLVHALFELGRLKRGKEVAVVGGGAAGLTAAAGAARRGCRVTVLEECGDLLPLWRNSRNRWLHPRIYDWPEPGSEEGDAKLPLLSWEAGMAINVADRILNQWEPLRRQYDIKVHRKVRNVTLLDRLKLSWNGPKNDSEDHNDSRFQRKQFDAIILAVGFGVEKIQSGVDFVSYWNGDSLDSLVQGPSGRPVRYLISGAGDGGLIDLLRVRLKNFRQETMLQEFLSGADMEEVKRRLWDLEKQYLDGKLEEENFLKQFEKLPVPKSLRKQMKLRKRGDTEVVLNALGEHWLSGRVSALNRYLVSSLREMNYIQGAIEVKAAAGGGYDVTFKESRNRSQINQHFDKVVIRQGPDSALKRHFKPLWEKIEKQLTALARLDQTRLPIYRDEDFADSTPGTGKSVEPNQAQQTEERAHPPTREDCFGREDLVRQLVEAVLEPEPRPVVVLGSPGIGKSTLTIEAFYDSHVKEHYGRRRYFVRLNAATSTEGMVSAIAKDMGVRADKDLWEVVKKFLENAPTLLVLDNTETPWEADRRGTEELLSQLRDIQGLALVCSVRGTQRPNIPRPGEPILVPTLSAQAARELFCSIGGFNREHPLLERLLIELQGLALAIKLLALESPWGELEVTWKLWEQKRTELLARPGISDALSSLAVSLELSITGRRMTEAARKLLSILAWLPEGAELEELEALLPGEGDAAVYDLLRTGLAFREQRRVLMLAPIREYVAAKRPPSPEHLDRVTGHYCEQARQRSPHVGWEKELRDTTWLVDNLANIEKSIREQFKGNRATGAIETAIELNQFIRLTGRGDAKILVDARDAAQRIGDTMNEARCNERLGRIHLFRSEYGEAKVSFEKALSLLENADPQPEHAQCNQYLGIISLECSEYEKAQSLFRIARDLFHDLRMPLGEANSIQRIGEVFLAYSEHEKARELFLEALAMFEEYKYILGQGTCIRSLGSVFLLRSEYAEAQLQFKKALGFLKQVNDLRGQAHCLKGLGDVFLLLEGYTEAREQFSKAGEFFKKSHYHTGHANCMVGIGDVCRANSDHAEARKHYLMALEIYEKIKNPHLMGRVHQRLAVVASDDETRRLHISAARAAWERIEHPDLAVKLRQELDDDT